jgi:ATP-dependent DNA helicase RecG
LQLAVYGELDISQIKTKPLGRKNIITKLVMDENRAKAYQFIDTQIKAGRQAFVITPLIEESDKLGVKSAKSEADSLKRVFPQCQIGLMHGRLKGAEKETIMKDFLANKTQILVSTSVVEVGVDVPNASVMLIEGAERFGLSQLHQFRGRVGRAEHQSYCFLFMSQTTQRPIHEQTRSLSSFAKEESPVRRGEVVGVDAKNASLSRLESFTKTQNGFELAELDLKQRGFGELYGQQQAGWNFKYFDPSYTSLIEPARHEALRILMDDLDLNNYPILKGKIKGKIVHFE